MTGHALDLILLVPTGLHDPCQAIGIVPVRRREGAMANFSDMKTFQKFAAVHSSDGERGTAPFLIAIRQRKSWARVAAAIAVISAWS